MCIPTLVLWSAVSRFCQIFDIRHQTSTGPEERWLCSDLQRLPANGKPGSQTRDLPITQDDDLLTSLAGGKTFTKLDLAAGGAGEGLQKVCHY